MKKILFTFIFCWGIVDCLEAQDVTQDQQDYINNGAIGFYVGYPIVDITGIYNPSAQWGFQGLADISGSRQSVLLVAFYIDF